MGPFVQRRHYKADDEMVSKNNLHRLHSLIAHTTYIPCGYYYRKEYCFGVDEKDIDHDLLSQVAEEALVTKFLTDQDSNLSHVVGERGIRLSGGQRQRIGIARALYKRSGLIIFDEATSSLDEFTERDIMKTIYNLDDSLTIVLVAHRISTLRECDEIYEMKDGSLILIGTYQDLVSRY